jgi:hypothetical protein
VKAEIPEKFLYVMPDEEVYAKIQLYNLGEISKEVDVTVEYTLMDWRGNKIFEETEMLAVNTQISYMKSFKIPKDSAFGKYVLYVKTSYTNKVASASAWFNVGKAPTIPMNLALMGLFIFLIMAIIIIVYKSRKIKKVLNTQNKINESHLAGLIKR